MCEKAMQQLERRKNSFSVAPPEQAPLPAWSAKGDDASALALLAEWAPLIKANDADNCARAVPALGATALGGARKRLASEACQAAGASMRGMGTLNFGLAQLKNGSSAHVKFELMGEDPNREIKEWPCAPAARKSVMPAATWSAVMALPTKLVCACGNWLHGCCCAEPSKAKGPAQALRQCAKPAPPLEADCAALPIALIKPLA